MTSILDISISHPLEREYEAWIISGIENYFSDIKVNAAVWAISPVDESTWPADIGVSFPAKLVGLQIKRPMLQSSGGHGTKVGFDQVKWSLANPKGQATLVSLIPEIYYCLSCFINRMHRRQSLAHCLFWRPTASPPSHVWYENPKALTAPSISHEMRWGNFVEKVLGCQIGYPAFDAELVSQFFARMRNTVRQTVKEPVLQGGADEENSSFNTLFLAVQI